VVRVVRRVGLYGASTLISAATAVVTIPITVHYGGVSVWADASVGMAVGAIVATVVSLGWPITGVSAVASMNQEERGQYFASSVSSRAVLLIPGLVVAGIVASLVAPDSAWISVLAALTLTLQGVNSNWYFVGANDPLGILLCDAGVRAVVLALASVILVSSGEPILFFSVQLLGGVASMMCALVRVRKHTGVNPVKRMGVRRGLAASRNQVHGSLTSIVATLYQSLPLLVVSAAAPSATGVFAIADRLLKLSNTAGQPFVQVIQGWIPADRASLRSRILFGCSIAAGLGIVGGGLLFGIGPLLSSILTQDRIVAPFELMLPMGVTLAATLLSQCIGVASLVPLGGLKSVARSAVLGACIAAIGLVLLVPTFGALGAAWSVAASELLVVAYQALALRTRLRAHTSIEGRPSS
jgi:O-antigen/teichoic acid export membrane protein